MICSPSKFKRQRVLLILMTVALFGLIFSLRYSMKGSPIDYGIQQRFIVVTKSTPTHKPMLPQTPSGIPKVIHFIYRDENVVMPYRDAFESCTRLNNDWLIVLWTDEAVKNFLQRYYPDRVKMFAAFPHKIQRADAIRYLILHKFGGLYLDLDMHCHRPLLPVLSPYGCFVDREREHQTAVVHNRQYFAMNSAMGCTPGHPFFRRIIDFVFHPDRIQKPFVFPSTIFDTTGPAMLTKIYDQWRQNSSNSPVTMLSESYFSPKINPRSGVFGTCRGMPVGMIQNHKGLRERACFDLKRLGFEQSDNVFINNFTVAIHQFTHLGYYNQKMSTFNVSKYFPQVKSYFQFDQIFK